MAADGAGLSARSLQRLFAEYVGVSPKWVIQRYRLHEAAERLAAGPVDQAHFIRDFKARVGMTVRRRVRQRRRLAANP